jgi:hypothetical protein
MREKGNVHAGYAEETLMNDLGVDGRIILTKGP